MDIEDWFMGDLNDEGQDDLDYETYYDEYDETDD